LYHGNQGAGSVTIARVRSATGGHSSSASELFGGCPKNPVKRDDNSAVDRLPATSMGKVCRFCPGSVAVAVTNFPRSVIFDLVIVSGFLKKEDTRGGAL
jgi:hypothetical protein